MLHEEAVVMVLAKGGGCLLFCELCSNLAFLFVLRQNYRVYYLLLDLRMTFPELSVFCEILCLTEQRGPAVSAWPALMLRPSGSQTLVSIFGFFLSLRFPPPPNQSISMTLARY